jgi:hypothetical protein
MIYPQTQPPPPAKLQLPKAKLEAKAVNEVTIKFLFKKKCLEYQLYMSAHMQKQQSQKSYWEQNQPSTEAVAEPCSTCSTCSTCRRAGQGLVFNG